MAGRRATDAEIEQLLQRIQDQFQGVYRGVSWSEARVIDSYGDSEERGQARAKDKDRNWLEVARDPSWDIDTQSHWPFLDPHGFRYYIAAGMAKCLLERRLDTGWMEFRFDLSDRFSRKHYWSEFTDEQLRVTAEFVLTMSRMSEDPLHRQKWRKAYESSWQKLNQRTPLKASKRR